MKFSGDVEVKTLELPDALEFTVTREAGLYESVVAPVITFVVLYFFWGIAQGWNRIVLLLIVISSAASYIASRLHGRKTKLRVTSEEIVAEGNLDSTFLTSIRLAAVDITAIRYFDGGEGGTPGLYVRHGWTSACLVPYLSRVDTDSIIDAIARRFPHLPTEHSSSLGWRGEPLIELGLSKLNRDDPNK
jgi:hypothetical protein